MANRQSVVEVLLRSYKRWISPLFSHACRFTPTCSEYAAQAVMERGWWCGGVLAIRRLLRCHPLGPSGYDPLPEDSDSEQLRP
ncbi:MAG: membrane protein insertion efficiency factor YidD [Acidobacteria bacterium]|nr:MAG: membrane protein insertion efficiency factor YidD [Acidobacteriota bacterium]